jgi:AcrR family transcriptional regulator
MDVRTEAPAVDRHSTKDKLLAAGLRVMHRNGFTGSSVRDVVAAAGVSQGAFTQHFKSKEDFGLQVIALYTQQSERLVANTLGNPALSPLARLRGFLDGHVASSKRDDDRCGCMYGNFCAEAASAGEPIRQELRHLGASGCAPALEGRAERRSARSSGSHPVRQCARSAQRQRDALNQPRSSGAATRLALPTSVTCV